MISRRNLVAQARASFNWHLSSLLRKTAPAHCTLHLPASSVALASTGLHPTDCSGKTNCARPPAFLPQVCNSHVPSLLPFPPSLGPADRATLFELRMTRWASERPTSGLASGLGLSPESRCIKIQDARTSILRPKAEGGVQLSAHCARW